MKATMMSSKYWLTVISNILWLSIALLCTDFIQRTILDQSVPVYGSEQIYFMLAVSIFGCASISDLFLSRDEKFSLFNLLVYFLMPVSIVFIFVSQLLYPLPFSASTVMSVLTIFIVFKSLSLFFTSDWHYPNFLCTKVMVLGDYHKSTNIEAIINQTRGRFSLEHFIDSDTLKVGELVMKAENSPVENNRLYLEAQKAGIKMIIASFSDRRGVMPIQQMVKCRMLGIQIVEVPTFYEFVSRKLYIENLKPSDLVFSTGFQLSLRKRFIKRAFDVFSASFGLLLFAPFFPIIALLIHLDSPGPIFFRQIRMGQNDKLFHVIKFRSMRADAEKNTGAVWAQKSDPRITRLGSFLRKSRIDEIPQLINVLQGDMSLIGPRPERPEFISELKKSIPFYAERHHVKPGVSGWAQVRYPYGASVEDALEKLRYDLYYIKKQSLLFDIEIVLRTILIVFTRNGAR